MRLNKYISETGLCSRREADARIEAGRVTINGVGYGTTPLTIPYLPPGAKRVRVAKTGYETEERVISADDLGGRTPIRIDPSKAGERTPP